MMGDIYFHETTSHSKYGTSTWSQDLLRPSRFTTTYVESFVTCMRTTVSSTSLNVCGAATTSKSISHPADVIHQLIVIDCFRHVLTGSYHNYFRIYDSDTLNDVVLQADKSAFKAKKIGGPLPGGKQAGVKNGQRGLRDAMQLDTLDFNKKILHASWHPRENTIAVSCYIVYLVLGQI
jgi:hypothetical protein